jgi:chemotaxis protein methyltransferase WspC
VVYDRIAALLKEKMGLDAESIGVACVERAVRERLTARGLEDVGCYLEDLAESDQELQELIEAVVVPETWFFRDSEAFAALTREVRDSWLLRHVGETLRLLSLPCSSGEEPFSMSMALLDAQLSPSRFHIEGIDISSRALERAAHGIYGKNSFRTKDLGFRDRYFAPVEGGYRLNDDVRQQVHFRHGNLLAPGWLHGAHGYDVIFCRNVLIYFDRATQRQAIEVLGRLLAASGLLFVGPSEAGLLLDHGFSSAGFHYAFAFRRSASAETPSVPKRSRSPLALPRLAPVKRNKTRSSVRPPTKTVSAGPPSEASEHWLEQARRLADQGKVAEALKYCDENLDSEGATAESFYLIGLLHDAAGRMGAAAAHYRKALYLDPQHREALAHLAVALQKDGDTQGAQRLLQRANRQLNPDERHGRR